MAGASTSELMDIMVPYRSSADLPLPDPRQRKQGRAILPNRPGVGSPTPLSPEHCYHSIRAKNGRLLERRATLDKEGFTFGKHTTAMSREEFWETEAVRDKYLPEVEALVRRSIPGVRACLIFDHSVRTGGAKLEESGPEAAVLSYASLVHSDTTPRSGHSRAKDQVLGTNETEVKYGKLPAGWGEVRPTREWQRELFRPESTDHASPEGRGGEHLIVNVWRPIQSGPVKQWHLALLDGTTMPQEDVHPSILVKFNHTPGGKAMLFEDGRTNQSLDEPNVGGRICDLDGNRMSYRVGEAMTPLYSASHQWVVYPDMCNDEILMLKVFDSRTDGRTRFNVHTAVKDPAVDDQVQRESIEVRCLVILEPAASSKL